MSRTPDDINPPDGHVELGRVAGVFGIRGEVRLHLHNREGTWLFKKRRVLLVGDGERRQVELRARRGSSGRIIGRIDGVETREAAEALLGSRIWVPREALPSLQAGEFYIRDVVGLDVVQEDAVVGKVRAVHASGPVDVLEIAVGEGLAWVPCLKERILSIDPEAGRVVVAPGALVHDEG